VDDRIAKTIRKAITGLLPFHASNPHITCDNDKEFGEHVAIAAAALQAQDILRFSLSHTTNEGRCDLAAIRGPAGGPIICRIVGQIYQVFPVGIHDIDFPVSITIGIKDDGAGNDGCGGGNDVFAGDRHSSGFDRFRHRLDAQFVGMSQYPRAVDLSSAVACADQKSGK